MPHEDEPSAGQAEHDGIAFADAPVDLSDQNWTDSLVFALFWALAVIVFLQFFTRYVLNNSIAWTEEIARYFLIAVTFTGAVMAVRKQSHIAVEFLYRWFGRTTRRVLQTFVDLTSIAFYGALTVYTIQLSLRTRSNMVSLHFGVIMVLNLMIGLLTPPVGMVLYVLSRVANVSFERCFAGTAPFLIPLVLCLILVTYVPAITLWLPTLLYR